MQPADIQATEKKNQQVGAAQRGARAASKGADLPCGGAFPDIADAAFEGFGAVPEGAHATIPKAFVGCRFGLPFRP